jgi:hypothetical protein
MKIKHVLFIVLLSIVCSANAGPSRPGDILVIENPPPPIDLEVVNRLWHYIKKAINAPADLPPPPIVMDWKVPIMARMGTQYPDENEPNLRFQISIAPRTVDMWEPEMVLYGIGHELVHYVFILRENNWDTTKRTYVVKLKHHCDREFKAITRGVADKLWNVWHSGTLRAKMYDEVIKSCGDNPEQ